MVGASAEMDSGASLIQYVVLWTNHTFCVFRVSCNVYQDIEIDGSEIVKKSDSAIRCLEMKASRKIAAVGREWVSE